MRIAHVATHFLTLKNLPDNWHLLCIRDSKEKKKNKKKSKTQTVLPRYYHFIQMGSVSYGDVGLSSTLP